MWYKRALGLAVTLALVMSGLGVLSAQAAQDSAVAPLPAQEEGGAWLGVMVQDGSDGIVITRVMQNSPAEEAGLRRGDVIVSVDDTVIESADQLVDVISDYAPGDVVKIVVAWHGDERSYEVELGERPMAFEMDMMPPEDMPHPGMQAVLNMLGVEMRLTDEGMMIESIAPDSPLADVGFQEGDIVTAINGQPIGAIIGGRMMMDLLSEDTLVFTVQRDGEEVEVTVENPMETLDEAMPDEPGAMMPMAPWSPDQMPPMAQPTQLGVSYRTLTAEIAAEDELPIDEGAEITEVFDDTPAAEAGLEVGDIITAVDGDTVDEEHTLSDRLYAYEEGDTVTLSVLREGEEIEIEVELGPKMPEMGPGMMPFGPMMGDGPQPFFFGPGFFYFMPWGGENGPHGGWQDMVPWGPFGGPNGNPHHPWEWSPLPETPPEQSPMTGTNA